MSMQGEQRGEGYLRPRVVPSVVTPPTMTWPEAQSAAMVASAQAHADLGVNRREPFVDVVAALAASGVPHLMWRPMGALFGAYVKQPGAPVGVLVNNGILFAARRMTLAHELGHHRFGHATSVDDEHTAGGATGRRAGRWTDQEKLAESFATWFLMPAMAVHTAVRVVTGSATRLATADQAYQVALLMGVPYRTLVRHLPTVRQVSGPTAREWAGVPPGRLKARAGAGLVAPAGGHGDVFVVGRGYDRVMLAVKVGDRLVFDATPATGASPDGGGNGRWPVWLVPVSASTVGSPVVLEVRPPAEDGGADGDHAATTGNVVAVDLITPGGATVRLRVAPRPWGLEQGRSLG